MKQIDFEIASGQVEKLNDHVNGVLSTIYFCREDIEKWLNQTNAFSDRRNDDLQGTFFHLSQVLDMLREVLLDSESLQAELEIFIHEAQTTTLMGRGVIIQSPLHGPSTVAYHGYNNRNDGQTQLGVALVTELLKTGMSQTDILKLVRKLIEMTTRNLGKEMRTK